MDMWPSHQPILKLSYEESLLFPHKFTATMLCFLTFGITLLPGKYLFPTSRELVSTSWEISIFTFYQINTFFHFWGTSYFHFWGTDMWPSHQPILNSLMRKVCFSQINLLLLYYVFLPLELTFYQVNTFFPLLGELVSTSWAISSITSYQMNTFFHFKETSCFLFLRNYMWPSHQTIFELSYEESLLFQHKSTAPMIYILTFENNLQSGKYFSHFWENRFHLLGNLKYYLIPDEYLFPLQRNFMLPLLEKLHMT